jgi:dihydrofolate reductase
MPQERREELKTVAYLAVSLDGYIADRNGGVDWLNEIPNPDQSDFGFAEFMKSVDAIVMGANTFRVVQSFGVWPYEKPVFVASNSIKEVPEGYEDRISLVQGEVRQILAGIRNSGYERLYIDGGKLIQNCLQAGILDEMIITYIPVALGGGIPLFAEFANSIQFEHKETEVIGIGLVRSRYLVEKST